MKKLQTPNDITVADFVFITSFRQPWDFLNLAFEMITSLGQIL